MLGGSHARGRERPGSDIDLGLLYAEADPFAVADVRALAAAVDDTGTPVVTDFHGWGRWVDGGAWLTIRGQRVDLLYRSLEHVERVIADAEADRYEFDHDQQPPFGFFSGTYLGEVAVAMPLHDPTLRFAALQRRVAVYPEALRTALVRDVLRSTTFELGAFAPKFAARADAYGTAACLARAVNQLVMVLFALNRHDFVNDKTALDEIGEMAHAPCDFGARVRRMFERMGGTPAELQAAVERVTALLRETSELAAAAGATRAGP